MSKKYINYSLPDSCNIQVSLNYEHNAIALAGEEEDLKKATEDGGVLMQAIRIMHEQL